jgi:DNA mismatch endonuclease (patch repair protein)
MRRIRSKDTTPELHVRHLVYALGYRYRLHRRDLPGRPDLVFASRRKVIFIHGCFWHQHGNCVDGKVPKSRIDYWAAKLRANVARDLRNMLALRAIGWGVLIIWECELSNASAIAGTRKRISRFLDDVTDEPQRS